MEKLTILHITDPHWLCTDWNYNSDLAEVSARHYKLLSGAFERLHRKQAFRDHFGDFTVLAHTGDSANFYEVHRSVPIAHQFSEIGTQLLPLLESALGQDAKYDLKLAVPGNHDVARSAARGKILDIKGNTVFCEIVRELGDSSEAFVGGTTISLRPGYFVSHPYELRTTAPDSERKRYRIVDNSDNSLTLDCASPRLIVGDTFAVHPDDRFQDFKNCFEPRGWKTPWTGQSACVTVGGRQLRFWLVNSSDRCGLDRSSDGKPLELVDIDDDVLQYWTDEVEREGSDDYMRIALLHHTPLPNYGSQNSKRKRDVFINNADFNTVLVKTNVKLVLSGHQHIGDVVYAAMPQHTNCVLGERMPPLAESGFLNVSGPCFLRVEPKAFPGFNVIEIPFADNCLIGDIRVTKYAFVFDKRDFFPDSYLYQVAFQRLNDIYPDLDELRRRREVLRRTISSTYSKEPIEPIERVLNIKTHKKSLNKWFEGYEACRSVGEGNIYGLYSVSILTPAAWWSLELTKRFRSGFIDYLKMRERLASTIDVSGRTESGFSASVLCAIDQALENGEKVKIEEGISQGDLNQLPHEDLKFIEGMLRSPKGIVDQRVNVALDNILRGERFGSTVKGLSLLGESAAWDIPLEPLQDDELIKFKGKYEVARIVLWPLEYFTTDYALRVIEFHRDFGVPLFWLPPEFLIGPAGMKRKQLGSFLLCSFRFPPMAGHSSRLPLQSYINNASCEKAEDADYYPALSEDSEPPSTLERIWGVDNVPKGLNSKMNPVAAEFRRFCRHPNIMFACDVYTLLKLKRRNDLEEFLAGREGKCVAWSNDET